MRQMGERKTEINKINNNANKAMSINHNWAKWNTVCIRVMCPFYVSVRSFFVRIILPAINNDNVKLMRMRISPSNEGGERNAMHNMDAMCMRCVNGKWIHNFYDKKGGNDLGSCVHVCMCWCSEFNCTQFDWRRNGIAQFPHLCYFSSPLVSRQEKIKSVQIAEAERRVWGASANPNMFASAISICFDRRSVARRIYSNATQQIYQFM